MINTDVPNILKANFVKNVSFEILRCLIRIPKFSEVRSRSEKSILKEKNKKIYKKWSVKFLSIFKLKNNLERRPHLDRVTPMNVDKQAQTLLKTEPHLIVGI